MKEDIQLKQAIRKVSHVQQKSLQKWVDEHPNWEEYDQAMVSQESVVVLVPPEKVYGSMI